MSNLLKLSEKSVQAQWEALDDGECFFVPSLDAEGAKKILLSMGYVPRKNAPEAIVGSYRGMWGVFCFRRPRKVMPGPETRRRGRKKTDPPTDYEGA